MNRYLLIHADYLERTRFVEGWDEVGKLLRNPLYLNALVYRINADYSVVGPLNIDAVRAAVASDTYEIGTMEPV